MKPILRPERVFVGPFQFDIIYSSRELRYVAETKDNNFGLTDPMAARIYVGEDMAPGIERDTVLHEILHACFKTFGLHLKLDTDEEERLVSTLTPILLGVLVDNPSLVEYLRR